MGHQKQITCLEDYPDNKFISGSLDKQVKVWDITTVKCLKTLALPQQDVIRSLKLITKDEAAVSSSNDINIVDLALGAVTNKLAGHKDLVTDLLLMKNELLLVSAALDQEIKVWSLLAM